MEGNSRTLASGPKRSINIKPPSSTVRRINGSTSGLLISRLHYDVTRRFRDETYRDSLVQMDVATALDLYSEVLANVQTHYVDTTERRGRCCTAPRRWKRR